MNSQQTWDILSESINRYEQELVFRSEYDIKESCKESIFDKGMRKVGWGVQGRMIFQWRYIQSILKFRMEVR